MPRKTSLPPTDSADSQSRRTDTKASGWQTAAIAVACGVFLFLLQWHLISTVPPWVTLTLIFGLLVSGFLTMGTVIPKLIEFVPLHRLVEAWVYRCRSERSVRNYIPYMTDDDRKIIGYLLAHNQKTFTAEEDGGYAATLMSRGIVVIALRPGQIFRGSRTPMTIPDEVWNVLMKHRDKLPISDADKNGPHPWRVPWNA